MGRVRLHSTEAFCRTPAHLHEKNAKLMLEAKELRIIVCSVSFEAGLDGASIAFELQIMCMLAHVCLPSRLFEASLVTGLDNFCIVKTVAELKINVCSAVSLRPASMEPR